ncbi:MAG: LysR family transcriptional regulator [Candidatus Competibacter sp.]|nr:LysR family transcriptional regulator [Candidatus Competibacter sp.]MDG4607462.1 LysR family transcriptional regulator [Candidatus Contendobacter sp.]HRD50574.1 LysR family transcriptional regulator [Candidatus Contendobacter sp.]
MLKIKNLHDLEIFVLTAHSGSLSAAARALDLSPAVASAGLKRLEAELGVVLLLRSTRSLRLTAEGERFLPAARLALAGLKDAVEEISTGRQVVRDHLQISMPSDLGRNQMLRWLDEFQARYPEVTLRIQLSDRIADIYRQPVDLAIRYGAPADSALVAVPLLPDNRRVLCAALSYVARHGSPAAPTELSAHNCLRFRLGDEVHEHWRFHRDGQETSVAVSGNRVSDDGDAVRRWAVAGCGIAYKAMLDVAPDLMAGRLVRLCPDWDGETAPLALMCADRRQLSPTVILLRDHFRQRCKETIARLG